MFVKPAIDTALHPFDAMRAIRQLLRQPGDTRQIFVLLRAMRGRSGVRAWRRFAASEVGAAVLAQRRDLLATLTDQAGLAALPSHSLGRAYHDFMVGQDLSAQALVAASQDWEKEVVPAPVALYRARMRDLHDVTHVVTGYGRDAVGELCLLTFMYAHNRNLGALMLVAVAWRRLSRPARAAVMEAWRNGRKARWLPQQDWEALLPQPLEQVRTMLGIVEPMRYRAMAR